MLIKSGNDSKSVSGMTSVNSNSIASSITAFDNTFVSCNIVLTTSSSRSRSTFAIIERFSISFRWYPVVSGVEGVWYYVSTIRGRWSVIALVYYTSSCSCCFGSCRAIRLLRQNTSHPSRKTSSWTRMSTECALSILRAASGVGM